MPDHLSQPELTLFAEEARVGHEWVATTRVRVSRRIVTEIQTLEVEVRREELIVTPEPLPRDETYVVDVGHAPVAPSPMVYVLRAEVPSVTLRVLPIEKVTLGVQVVTEDRDFATTLAAERLELTRRP